MSKIKTIISSGQGLIQERIDDSEDGSMIIDVPIILAGTTVPLPSLIRGQFVYVIAGTLAVGTDSAARCNPSTSFRITEVRLDCKTAPTGAAIIVDVNVNAASIFSLGNRPQIAAAATSGTSSTFLSDSLSENDLITIDIDQVGSSVAGSNLTISIRGYLI